MNNYVGTSSSWRQPGMARAALSEGSTGPVGALKQIMEASRGGDLWAQEKIVSRLRQDPWSEGGTEAEAPPDGT